jgi:hypothetical protein
MNVSVPPIRLTKLRHALCLGTAVVALASGILPTTAEAVVCALDVACIVDGSTAPSLNNTGINLGGGGYTFTVNNPATTWSLDPPAPLVAPSNATANGVNPVTDLLSGYAFGTTTQYTSSGLTANYGALVAQAGAGGYIPIGTTGAILTGMTGTLGLGMWSPTPGSGTQSVTVSQNLDPTLLAGLNVFAKEHALNSDLQGTGPGKVDTGVNLSIGSTYYIHPTNSAQTWAIGRDAGRTTTAEGVDPNTFIWIGTQYTGDPTQDLGPELICTSPFWDGCKPRTGNTFGDGGIGQFIPGTGVVPGYRFGELVALVDGKYYGVGNGLKLSGVSGELYLLMWDDNSSDNFGFINVAVNLVVPEPASMMLLGTALLGFGLARRKRRAG